MLSIKESEQIISVLRSTIIEEDFCVIDCPVDYSENLILTQRFGKLTCPITHE